MSRPARPICVEHACEMRPLKNGTLVLFHAEFGPYEVWGGDQYQCPKGGERIVTGWADRAVAMHHTEGFEESAARADVTVVAK